MSESQSAERPETTENDRVPDLNPQQEAQLSELVYKLIRDEILQERERSGRRAIWR